MSATPTIGRIIHAYHGPAETKDLGQPYCAAIVTGFEGGKMLVTVFLPDSLPSCRALLLTEGVNDELGRSWQWPQREGR